MGRLTIARTWDGDPVPAAERCVVELAAAADRWIVEVDAAFHGDPPPPEPAGSHDGLWRYEVVELFVAAARGREDEDDAAADYTEVELSPHGHHLALRFAGVRRRVALVDPLAVYCRVDGDGDGDGDRWRGRLELPLAALPPEPWRANAFAVHGAAGERRYLAATPLPGSAPDFHQPRRFSPFAL